MEKLPMCRFCLAENVRMYIVVNKNLRQLYEKLTDNPFITEDSRPMLACFFCCTKLKQCYQFQRKCLEAEELFAQMMNKDYEPIPLLGQPEFNNGFIQTPILQISIVGECYTDAIKEVLPAVLGDQSNELEVENTGNSFSDLEPLTEYKIEAEEHELSRIKPKLLNVITETQKQDVESHTFKTVTNFIESLNDTKHGVDDFNLDTNCRKTEMQCEKSNKVIVCEKPFKCSKKRSLTSHVHTHSGDKLYKCEVCQRRFTRKSDLTKHIPFHTGVKPFKCDVCPRSFSHKSGLMSHIRTHTGDKPFKCDVCHSSFNQKGALTKHVRVHTGENIYKCDVCPRSFSHKSGLMSHIRTHTGDKPFKCDVCHSSFNQKGALTKHVRVHTGKNIYKCDVCPRSFSQKSGLMSHIRTHTGDKPFKCDVCHSSFNQKGTLTKHVRVHTGKNIYKCDVCPRSFSQKSGLMSHIRIHTGEKPFKCDVCHRSFNEKGNSTKHGAEKPSKCEVCHRSFSVKSNLNKHVSIHTYKSLLTGSNRKHTSDKLRLLYRLAHLQMSKNLPFLKEQN